MLPDRMLPFWDNEANEVPVENAFPKSISPAHWIDPVCGHRWVQRIGAFTGMFLKLDAGRRIRVCPACEGNVLIVGKNDLGTTHPELAKIWSLSNDVAITEVSKGSAKVVSWECEHGHQWKSKIKDQAYKGLWCRKCNHKSTAKIPKGKTLLKDSHPDLYSQLVSVVDNKQSRDLLVTGSSLTAVWRCVNDHEYKARVSNRTILGRNCPYCAGRYAIPGETDLATTNPEVMKYWDYENNSVSPEEIKKSAHKEFYWQCERKHQWKATPHHLTELKQFCPFCSGKRVIPGETDLATVYPEKLKLWNYEKNSILPNEVSSRNTMVVHWKCAKGHEWTGKIDSMTGCARCIGRKGLKGFNGLVSMYPHLLAEWDYEKNDKDPSKYSYGSSQRVWWICDQKHSWEAPVCKRTGKNVTNCPTCALAFSTSKAELEVCSYLESLGIECETSDRTVLEQGQELDIYIPNKNFAIEYNGIYWHSEAFRKDKNYHYDKWLACKDKGIQLIQIWEDEWNRNPEQIKRMLAHKLGISNERKVFARKTTVVELTKMEAEPFLNENHVQGYASGSYYLGLKDKSNDEIVSVLVLKKEAGTEGKTLNIIRYATSANVVGGFTKLLKHAEKQYQPESFLTFSDHCVSDGGLYENHGFIADKQLPPDYMYVVGNVRRHKFGYRLKRFKDDPALLWEEGLTERELADLNGLKRIWDAGKTRWVLSVA